MLLVNVDEERIIHEPTPTKMTVTDCHVRRAERIKPTFEAYTHKLEQTGRCLHDSAAHQHQINAE